MHRKVSHAYRPTEQKPLLSSKDLEDIREELSSPDWWKIPEFTRTKYMPVIPDSYTVEQMFPLEEPAK